MNAPNLLVTMAALAALAAGGFVADRVLRAGDAGATGAPGALPAAPDVRLQGLDGGVLSLADFAGQPLLVNFWATWCKPCRKEIPLLMALRDEYRNAGLQVVGIAIDELEATRSMAERLAIDYPVMVGEQEGIDAMVAFGAPTTALPYTALVDARGRVVAGHVGELHREDAVALLNKLP